MVYWARKKLNQILDKLAILSLGS